MECSDGGSFSLRESVLERKWNNNHILSLQHGVLIAPIFTEGLLPQPWDWQHWWQRSQGTMGCQTVTVYCENAWTWKGKLSVSFYLGYWIHKDVYFFCYKLFKQVSDGKGIPLSCCRKKFCPISWHNYWNMEHHFIPNNKIMSHGPFNS